MEGAAGSARAQAAIGSVGVGDVVGGERRWREKRRQSLREARLEWRLEAAERAQEEQRAAMEAASAPAHTAASCTACAVAAERLSSKRKPTAAEMATPTATNA